MDATSAAPAAPTGKSRYTTISIPQPLYEDIKKAIEGSGFRSPTEFLVYVARMSLQGPLVREDARVRGPPFYGAR
ncbi:MAG: hypothetical protein QOE90_3296 [Thermoplasmata archaeon]|jgi:hypothetical protein|nr:hypothetical protein [Thermoplasmata archaeon]